MAKNNDEMIEIECDLCGHIFWVMKYRGTTCEICNWTNIEYAVEHPDEVVLHNFVTFNRAKKLYAEGKPLESSFEEFMEVLRQYGEVEFRYRGERYAVIRGDIKTGEKVRISSITAYDGWTIYSSYEEFVRYANIGGKLLVDIWDEVVGVDELQ